MRTIYIRSALTLLILGSVVLCGTAAIPEYIKGARRIVFLGDSITDAGHYIGLLETRLRELGTRPVPEFVNLGLPSETCSGLSEPDHPFPRPDVHERLDRVLSKAKPDVVIACYGMNDGIYYPFSEKRFAAYQSGIERLIDKVRAAGAKVVLMTPPAFDPQPLARKGKLRPATAEKFAWFGIYEGYDAEVMRRYAAWVMTQKGKVDMVIDLHTPMNTYLVDQRRTNPDFAMSADGVHVDEEGHRVLAAAILKAWGEAQSDVNDPGLLKLVLERQQVLHRTWVSHVGHKRPGVAAGLPVDEATAKGREIEQRIQEHQRGSGSSR